MLVAVAFLVVATQVTAQTVSTPARDARRTVAAGTGVIGGIVLTDEAQPRPLRRARVMIASSDWQTSRTEITNDEGRFAFRGLPAARYTVSVTKAGYVAMTYGARRPQRSGTPIVLADGQRITSVIVKLPRTSVITGTIVDHNGDPFFGATVQISRRLLTATGKIAFEQVGATAYADDRGHYRAWGLGAGDYIVAAFVRLSGGSAQKEAVRMSDADIERALRAGVGNGSERSIQERTVGYAPVYYPGTFSLSQATPVTLGAGEERANVDLTLSLAPTAKIQGTVAIPEGVNPQTLTVVLLEGSPESSDGSAFQRNANTSDGTFEFYGLPPGQYKIAAQARGTLPAGGASKKAQAHAPPTHWAATDVIVNGEDISGLTLTLQPGFRISGRVQFDGTRARPDPTRVLVRLQPVHTIGDVSFGVSSVAVDADGRFTVTGTMPGRYRLNAAFRDPSQSGGWRIRTSTVGGQNALDVPIELRDTVDGAAITFTDRISELSGALLDGDGQPAADYEVVAFPSDRSFWVPESRRIRLARPSTDGKYLFAEIPPGEYLIATVPADIEPADLQNPPVLERLGAAAMKVTIEEGEKKVLDLRLASQIR
jgi:uncharacterized protein (DUF2141 family)